MKNATLRVLPALLAAAFSGGASAAAFQLWEQNASGIATAYAGSAAIADNASTIFFNPAGMTRLPGIQLSAGVTGVGPSFKFSDNGSSGLLGTGGDGGNAGSWAAVPNAYLSWQVAPDWFIGLGISSPFGLKMFGDDNSMRAPGSHMFVKSQQETARILSDGMEAGKVLIPTHEELWDLWQARAADPDGFIARKNDEYQGGDTGKPGITQEVIDSINA